MDIVYILVDDGNRRYFYLGKGPWPAIISAWHERSVEEAIVEACVASDRDEKYWRDVASLISGFCMGEGGPYIRLLASSELEYHCITGDPGDPCVDGTSQCCIHGNGGNPYERAGSRFDLVEPLVEIAMQAVEEMNKTGTNEGRG